jgi:hypothetical protein
MRDFYLMVCAVVVGMSIVQFFHGVLWPLVERGLEKWAA